MAAAKKTTAKSKTSARSSRSSGRSSASPRGRGSSRSGGSAQPTVDHEEIRQWAEERQGEPACVRGTGGRGDTGMLRIDFPQSSRSDVKLQKISWDEWFEKFDERGLALLHQDKTAGGKVSRFNKLVSRETAKAANEKKSRAKTRTATS